MTIKSKKKSICHIIALYIPNTRPIWHIYIKIIIICTDVHVNIVHLKCGAYDNLVLKLKSKTTKTF